MSTTLPPTTPTPTSTTTTTTTTVAPQPIPPQPITPIIPIPSCCDIDGAKVCGSVYFKNESLSGGDIFASKRSIQRVDGNTGSNISGIFVAGKMKLQSSSLLNGATFWVNIEDFQLYDVTMTDLSGDSCIPITGYLPEPNPEESSPTIPNFVKKTIPPLNSNTNTPPIPINPLNSGIVTSTTITTPSNNNSNTTATMTTTIKVGLIIPNANRCGTGEDTCNNLGF